MRPQAWLVDARLSYLSGDRVRGRRSPASALRLAEGEQLRLPFALERGWLEPVLRRDPELARAHGRLLAPTLRGDQLPSPRDVPDQAPILVVEPLTEREREVLRHVSGLLSTAEIASEMDISRRDQHQDDRDDGQHADVHGDRQRQDTADRLTSGHICLLRHSWAGRFSRSCPHLGRPPGFGGLRSVSWITSCGCGTVPFITPHSAAERGSAHRVRTGSPD